MRKLHPVIAELIVTRKAWKLSQADVAKRACIGRTVISLSECGCRSTKFGLLQRWADALGYEIVLKRKTD